MKCLAATQCLPRLALALGAILVVLATAATGQVLQPRMFELAIIARKVEGPHITKTGRAAGVIRVVQGEDVELLWTSDEDTVLHLHGYNVETRLQAGGKATMRFQARATGRFAVETHGIGRAKGRHLTLVYVEVHPR